MTRDVVRIITPGTVTESSMLEEGKSNYLCAVYLEGGRGGAAFCDISTGEFCCASFENDAVNHIINELGRFAPVLDGACCVDDTIEIAVALDDGSVYRFRAPENAPERASFRLDAEAAAEALPEGPAWGEAEKIIRRREGGRVLGCWRFQSETDDGRTLCIDVSAETGKEYDIRLL